ncbi:MAG: flagellin [Acidimicrobiales bacterium]
MRVSDASRHETLQFQLERTGIAVDRAMESLTTGRRINRLSDDPDRAVVADRVGAEVSALETYQRAADNARSWLATQDTALQGAVSLVQRARELAIAAGSSQSPEAAAGIAIEIESIRSQLIDAANSRFDGRAVFAGFAEAAVASDGTLLADGGDVMRRVSDTLVMSISASAADAFGFTAGDDLFTVLEDLATAVRSGDTAAVGGAGLQRLLDRQRDLTDALGAVGARTNNVEHAVTTSTTRRDDLLAYRSSIVDIDFAEAAVELTAAETAYQAVLAATARLQRTNLLDYLG